MPIKPRGEISNTAKELCRQFPKASTAALGRMLLAKFPHLAGIDSARNYIRIFRGIKKPSRFNEYIKPHEITPKLEMPESNMRAYPILSLDLTGKKMLLISDLHVPYHDIAAIKLAFKHAKKNKVDAVYINGDLVDFYPISNFQRDPRRTFVNELTALREFLAYLRQEFPTQDIYWKQGNHEERWENFMMNRAPEFLGVDDFELKVLLKLDELKITYIKDKQRVVACGLNIMHGHEWKASFVSPVNPARGYFLRAKQNVIVGHHHQSSEHTESTLNGSIMSAWSTGCLCGLHPEYMPLNKHNLGFAMVDFRGENEFYVSNRKIIKGKVL